jgi:ribosome-binding factor A
VGDEKQRRASLQGLQRAAGFLRRELGRRMRLRRVPELDVRHDPGIDATQRVAELLHEAMPAGAGEAQAEPAEEDVADDDPDA